MLDFLKKKDSEISVPAFRTFVEYVDEVTGEKIEICKPKVIHMLLIHDDNNFISTCKLVALCVKIENASLSMQDVVNLDMRQFLQINLKIQELLK